MASSALILLVDDIPDHATTYARALRADGFRLHLASSGEEALDLARTMPPDLVVVDVRLPDMTGWDLCRRLKSDETIGSPPVVVLTAEVSRECAKESAELGCKAWLAHPTRADDLVRAVRQVLASDLDVPPTPDAALLGVTACAGCGEGRIRATLRVGLIQQYACLACGFRWRVETQAI